MTNIIKDEAPSDCYYCKGPIGCISDCYLNGSLSKEECDLCINKPLVYVVRIEGTLYALHVKCIANPRYYAVNHPEFIKR